MWHSPAACRTRLSRLDLRHLSQREAPYSGRTKQCYHGCGGRLVIEREDVRPNACVPSIVEHPTAGNAAMEQNQSGARWRQGVGSVAGALMALSLGEAGRRGGARLFAYNV